MKAMRESTGGDTRATTYAGLLRGYGLLLFIKECVALRNNSSVGQAIETEAIPGLGCDSRSILPVAGGPLLFAFVIS